jgi:hypothetical protein
MYSTREPRGLPNSKPEIQSSRSRLIPFDVFTYSQRHAIMNLSTNVTFIYQEMIDFGDLRAIRSISPIRGFKSAFPRTKSHKRSMDTFDIIDRCRS